MPGINNLKGLQNLYREGNEKRYFNGAEEFLLLLCPIPDLFSFIKKASDLAICK